LPLSRTVSTAVAMASQAYFLRSGAVGDGRSRGFMWTIVGCVGWCGQLLPASDGEEPLSYPEQTAGCAGQWAYVPDAVATQADAGLGDTRHRLYENREAT